MTCRWVAALLASSCGRLEFSRIPDAPVGDAPGDAELGPFGSPRLLTELSNTAFDDDPTATDDLLEIYFASNRSGGLGSDDIWVARRASPESAFSPPTLVTDVSTSGVDESPGVSADGLTLYWTSDRPSALGGNNIWVATRPDRAPTTPWSTPQLQTDLSSAADGDYQAQPAADGLRLVMYRLLPTSRDLFEAQRVNTTVPWTQPTAIAELSPATSDERSPCLSQNGRTIYFSSDRSSAPSLQNIFTAKRPTSTAPFEAITPLTEVNSSSDDDDPWVSSDGRVLFFSSNRSGNSEIYEARR